MIYNNIRVMDFLIKLKLKHRGDVTHIVQRTY